MSMKQFSMVIMHVPTYFTENISLIKQTFHENVGEVRVYIWEHCAQNFTKPYYLEKKSIMMLLTQHIAFFRLNSFV